MSNIVSLTGRTSGLPVFSYEGGIAPVSTGYQVQVREIGGDAGDRSDDPFVLTSHFPFISE